MKRKTIIKSMVAIVLALVMVIPGVYLGTPNQDEVQAAVSMETTDMLNIKLQVAVDQSDAIRFITSVNSLDYSKVGFEVTTPSGTKIYETTTVYERIVSVVTKDEFEFSPKLVDATSEYFVTAMLKATAGVDYTVRAFVCEIGSTDKIYGPSRTVALEDAEKDTINMMVDFATTANATYDVYDGSTKIGTAKVIGDKNVRITLTSKTVDSFPSATKLTFKSGSTQVGTAIYRNYYTKYEKAEDLDTTWYTVNTGATEFVVASAADMQGLASLVRESTQNFNGKKITLIKSIVFNKGTVTLDADGNATGFKNSDGSDPLEWNEIGVGTSNTSSIQFRGTFDGDNNTISGIYLKNTDSGISYNGVFGSGTSSSTIKNLRVANSYMSSTSSRLAGIIGGTEGNVENCYVGEDVYLTGTSEVGGIVGYFGASSSVKVSKCWFAGKISASSTYIGGIVGRIYSVGTKTIEGCLFTGDVDSTRNKDTQIGGILGGSGNTGTVVLKNDVSNGHINTLSPTKAGSVLGSDGNTKYLTIENVYTNDNIEGTTFTTGSGEMVGTGTGVINNGTTAVKGIPTKLTATELQGEQGYVNTDLDFYSVHNKEGIWVATANGPQLRAFSTATPITTFTQTPVNVDWYAAQYTNYTVSDGTTTINTKMALPSSGVTFELDSAGDLFGLDKITKDQITRTINGATLPKKIVFGNQIIKLTKDIDLNPGWKPIVDANGIIQNAENVREFGGIGYKNGDYKYYFKGTFDGNNHTVRGVYMNTNREMCGFVQGSDKGSLITNLKLIDSYIKNDISDDSPTAWDVGSIVGYCYGEVSNIYSNAIVVADAWGGSGIIGRYRSDSESHVKKLDNCWFDGELIICGNSYSSTGTAVSSYGGVVGRIQNASKSQYIFTNCLNTGKITRLVPKSKNATYVGGVVGGISSGSVKIDMKDCLNVGTIVDNAEKPGGLLGISTGTLNISESYTVTEGCATVVGVTGGTINGGSTLNENDYKVSRASILLDAAKTGAPGLFNEDGSWICDTESGTGRGTPILEDFAAWWKEIAHDDGVLKVLLVGNSFCYYHTDELYGMLEADGIKAIVANVYDSGCTMQEHVTFLNNNTERYEYIAIEGGVKKSVSSRTMTQCFNAEDWDVISFQQHFDPSEAMDYATASGITLSYAKTMYDYLKANYPEARLLWQMTWAYQVGYKGYAGNDFSTSNPNKCVLDTAKQTLNYENISAVARAVCEENDVELVPNGDAWQLARATVGDILCDKSGTNLAQDTTKTDNYHDGDVGGGQFLNACGWYEVITGKDCRNNTFVPSYSLLINTEFNAELTEQAHVIAALKEAAHTAVMNAR